MYEIYLSLLGIALVVNSVLIYLLSRSPQRGITIVSLIFLLFEINIWFAPKFWMNAFFPDGVLFETLSRIAALGYIFVPPTFLIFALSYSAQIKMFKYILFWIVVFLPPIIFLYLSWTTNLIGVHDPSTAINYSWGFETPTGKLWSYYIGWYDILMGFAFAVLLFHYFFLTDRSKKNQLFWILVAVVIPFVVTSFTSGILPMFNIFIFPIGLILLNLMTVVGVSVVIRYGLFVLTPLSVLANINHAIISVDIQGTILQMNPSSEKILKSNSDQLSGKRLEKVIYLQDLKRKKRYHIKQLLKPVFDKGKSLTYENFAIVNRRSQVFYHTISISPIYEEKTIVGANIFLQDMKRERDREKQRDDIFRMMSHEIKTPITSIKAYNQILLREFSATNGKKKRIAQNMDNQLNRLTRLIQDFMELSQLHSGKLKMKRALFEMDPFIRSLVDTMRITYRHRQFIVSGKTDASIFGDKDRVEQIIINFITNAVKYSAETKPIKVLLSCDGTQVIIGVQDFGIGIAEKYTKRIFNPFFRIEGRDRGSSGLGIGLFIANLIARANDGKIWVESEEGRGSTFYCSFPLAEHKSIKV